jgi:chemotaxis protein histidine kinase CheA
MASLADLPEVVGFFSCSREDDEASDGSLSALRDRIQSELSGQLGRSKASFRLWQDQKASAPGKLWEAEIKKAVEESVFFIPVVTPSAVSSRYCKFEFETFLARERELGRTDLVFPLLYIAVRALENEELWRKDPVLSIIGVRQYFDWRPLLHLDVRTPAVSEQIERFCDRIVEVLREPWVSPEERPKRQEVEAQERGEQARRAEAARRAEVERQRAEVARQAEEERQRAEAARRVEVERQRAEVARQAEEEKQRAEAARQAEEERQRAEAARRAEVERQRAEVARQAEEERQRAEAAGQEEAERQREGAIGKAVGRGLLRFWNSRTPPPVYAPDPLAVVGDAVDRSGRPVPWRWERSLSRDLLGQYGLVLAGAAVVIAALAHTISFTQMEQADRAGRPMQKAAPVEPPQAQSPNTKQQPGTASPRSPWLADPTESLPNPPTIDPLKGLGNRIP